MNTVYRVYVEKRSEYAVEAKKIYNSIKSQLKIKELENLQVINRYDVSGVDFKTLQEGINIILSEPMVDDVILEDYPLENKKAFAIEYLPGQYDQRADACEQCFQLLTGEKTVKVRCAKLIVLTGSITDDDVKKIETYLINPVDQRLASLAKVCDLDEEKVEIKQIPTVEGFIDFTDEELKAYLKEASMAMNFDDLKVTLEYFKIEEKRNPTETELKVLDTYWSDHCRHTTFSTIITDINVKDGLFKEVLEKDIDDYKASRHLVYGLNLTRPITLMDLVEKVASGEEIPRTTYMKETVFTENDDFSTYTPRGY